MEEIPQPQPKAKAPGKKKPPATTAAEAEMQRHREYIMSRLDIFMCAHNALKQGNYSQDFEQAMGLAEFLAGDHI